MVLLYTLLYIARLGSLIRPVPFWPYVGMIARLTYLFNFDVVRAFKLFERLGFLTPIFIVILLIIISIPNSFVLIISNNEGE